MMFVVVICAAIASGVVFANVGSRHQATGALDRERAFQAAEAGIDWGLARMRIVKGALPSPAAETRKLDRCGEFRIRYVTGTANLSDDDGDGTVDEADEAPFAVIRSTGTVGSMSRSLELLVWTPELRLDFPAAVYIDDESPLVDLSGAAFTVSGEDHLLDGTLDPTLPPVYGLSSPATPDVLEIQLRDETLSNVTGLGDTPSVGESHEFDFPALVELAEQCTTIELLPGTHSDEVLGTPTPDGVEVVQCDGDLHLSGTTIGAGVLLVRGDLQITGSFDWVGVILVEGRVRLNGGGSKITLTGAMAVGDEITDSLKVAGSVDLLYSTDAVLLAGRALSVPLRVCWRETAAQ